MVGCDVVPGFYVGMDSLFGWEEDVSVDTVSDFSVKFEKVEGRGIVFWFRFRRVCGERGGS